LEFGMEYEMTPFEKEMEQNLLEMRSVLLSKISKSDNDFRNLVGSGGTGDSVDIASDDLASKKMEAIGKLDVGKLNAINQALVRIRNGKYGVCAMCGKKIPEDRLRAIPYALLCMPCKRKSEHR
jgi:RNA polymerase-binding transcription factor DksA